MSADENTKKWPREDNMYKKKESLPFDESRSLVWLRSEVNTHANSFNGQCIRFFVYLIIGLSVGLCALAMARAEDSIVVG